MYEAAVLLIVIFSKALVGIKSNEKVLLSTSVLGAHIFASIFFTNFENIK
jgi:hypothetical protein